MACPYSSLNQKWAGGPGDDCETNGPLADVSMDDFQMCDRTISVKITDMERKANINLADQTMLQQGLMLVGVDAGEIPSIANCILDWIDTDDIPRVGGAESEYYEGLKPPYSAKNGTTDDLTELLMVRGVTEDMYWGSYATNHVSAAVQQVDRFGRTVDVPVYPIGLEELFTSQSSGKINVNTASAEVLRLIPGIDEPTAQTIVGQRDQAPYHTLNEVPVPSQLMPQIQRYCTVHSSTWKIEVTVQGGTRKFYAIVRANSPRDIPILVFYWEDM
jgi:general secretion pathway protein K